MENKSFDYLIKKSFSSNELRNEHLIDQIKLIEYYVKVKEHKAVEKKWDTLVFVTLLLFRQVIGGLIKTTSSFCLTFII